MTLDVCPNRKEAIKLPSNFPNTNERAFTGKAVLSWNLTSCSDVEMLPLHKPAL